MSETPATTPFSVRSYIERLTAVLASLDVAEVERGIDLIRAAGEAKRKILVCGNGGSALTASHYINDWNKMTILGTGRPFRGTSLSDNMGLVTAWANDVSYDDIYSEQLKNLMDAGDLVIAISGSGNSENVVRALHWANDNGGETLAVCGYDGGRVRQIAQHSVWVRSFDMQICEDLHCIFGHMTMKALCGSPIRD